MAQFTVLSLDTADAWRAAIERLRHMDLTVTHDYCQVFEDNGDGQALCITYEDGLGTVTYPVMRRSITDLPFTSDACLEGFDLSTPYGYGGMYVDSAPGDRGELLSRFRTLFSDYARDTKTISEFIRFHPILENHVGLDGLIDDIRHHNDNVVIDLRQSPEEMLKECRQSFRSGIRQTERLGLKMEHVAPEDFLDDFIRLYHKAMKRRQNRGYLNFRPAFFRNLFNHLAENIHLFVVREKGKLLAAAVILTSGKTIDYFLAANERQPRRPYVNHFLLFEVAKWAKESGFQMFHLGGGADTIQFFKSGFSKSTMPYFIGSHIFDHTAYAALVESGQRSGKIPDTIPPFFFPAYRAYLSETSDRALLDMLNSSQST